MQTYIVIIKMNRFFGKGTHRYKYLVIAEDAGRAKAIALSQWEGKQGFKEIIEIDLTPTDNVVFQLT